jgi:sulfatase-like protein
MSLLKKFHSVLSEKRFLTRETLLFSVLALLVPNAIYIFLSFFYCPFRTFFVLLLSFVCLIGLYVHRALFFVLLLTIMVVDALVLISNFFQMPLPMLLDSLRYAGNLSIWNSALYLAAILVLLGSFALTYWAVVAAKQNKPAINLVPFFVLLIVYASIDWWANSEPQEFALAQSSLSDTYVPIQDAASLHGDLERHLKDAKNRNVLIVMVEGLGSFASEDHRALIWDPLLKQDVREKYAIETGSAVYFGSTTSGEVRELCNLKGDYRDFRERDSADCLPARAQEAGYKTAAFHAFSGGFFERFDWYPKIGFQEMFFLENNVGLNTERQLPYCGIAFHGLCDADVARSVESYLLEEDGDRKFAYWLTLNSHKPVQPGEVPARLACDDGGVFGDVELCRMGEQWLNVSHLVKEMALNPELAETEILLVGDHHPPLFTRSARKLFEPGKVAWLHLNPRTEKKALAAASSTLSELQN